MNNFTVLQVSDTHLSRSHAYFQDNWEACLAYIAQTCPDLVVVSGDVSFNGPDVHDDIVFAREQLERIACRWVALPGNHDVGEPGDNPRLGQCIDEAMLERWKQHFGADRFCIDLGAWRLLGINSELLGSGLDAEHEQWEFLDAQLSDCADRNIGFFIHKPLFIDDPESRQANAKCLPVEPRKRLLNALRNAHTRFVGSGHVHAYHQSSLGDMAIVWAPSTAFIDPQRAFSVEIANRAGVVQWTFDGCNVRHEMVEPPRFANIDLTNWTRHSGTTITLPPLAQRAID
ncbi:MAG: 3',5'-cyclic AMP phosphodiesterase CpdA [Gammaproteobacteria bacterium]|jgi:3',5'-cyclic AMP phosphodiesterase CpdA